MDGSPEVAAPDARRSRASWWPPRLGPCLRSAPPKAREPELSIKRVAWGRKRQMRGEGCAPENLAGKHAGLLAVGSVNIRASVKSTFCSIQSKSLYNCPTVKSQSDTGHVSPTPRSSSHLGMEARLPPHGQADRRPRPTRSLLPLWLEAQPVFLSSFSGNNFQAEQKIPEAPGQPLSPCEAQALGLV